MIKDILALICFIAIIVSIAIMVGIVNDMTVFLDTSRKLIVPFAIFIISGLGLIYLIKSDEYYDI